MKKLFKILLLSSAAFFIIWLIALCVYVSFNIDVTELPNSFRYPMHFLILFWAVFGVVYLIKERKAVKKFLIEFINE